MNTIKKLLVLGLAASTVFGSTSAVFAALSQSQIDAIVAMLQSFNVDQNTINNVKAALTGQPVSSGSSSQTTPSTACEFNRNLTVGSKGDDVKCLQKYLNESGFKVAESGVGSPGNESTYFGPATRVALIKWQKANNISPASGFFGPLSRAKYTELVGKGSGTTGGQTGQLPASSYLKVEAVSLPGSNTLPDGSLYNKVLRLKFSAGNKDEKVIGLTVTRGGFISNTNITGVSLWDDNGNRYGNIITSLTSEGKAVLSFPTTPFVVPAGQSKYLNLAINIDASANSGSVSFSVNSVNDVKVSSESSQVEGPFPLVGQTYTIVDGSSSLADVRIDDVAISGTSEANAQSASYEGNVEVGDIQREVFKLRVNQNNSKEAIKISRITFYVAGNIVESTDLKNFKLYSPEGNVLATAERPYDRYVTFNLETPYVIEKGLSRDFSVRADITDGASRYFTLYIQNDYDVLIYGVNSGAGILVTDNAGGVYTESDTKNTTTGYFKIKQGDLVVSKANTSPSGKVLAPGMSEALLAEFIVKSAGEKIEIRKMGLAIKYSFGQLNGSVSIRDKDSKETYLSLSADTTGLQTTSNITSISTQQNLSSYIYLESGQSKTIQVIGQLPLNATSSWNYTVYVGNFNIKRYSTNDFTDKMSNSVASANQVSVGDVVLTVVKNSSFANTTQVKGSQEVKIGEFILQASNVDNIRVSSINLKLNTTTGISNLKVHQGDTPLGSTISSPSSVGNVFTMNLDINKNQSKIISVYADILNNATGTLQVSVAQNGITGYGISTSKTLDNTPSSDVVGQTITLSDAKLNIVLDASAPVSKIILAGSENIEISKLKFTPISDNMKLIKLTLSLATGTASSTIENVSANFGTLALYSSNQKVSGDIYIINGDVVFDEMNVNLEKDKDTVLTVKANFNDKTSVTPKSIFAIKVKSTSTADLHVEKSSGGVMDSNVTLGSGNAISNYYLMHVAAPVITRQPGSNLIGSNVDIYKFKVEAKGGSDLVLSQVKIKVSVTNASSTSLLNNFKLVSESDNNELIATSSASITGNGSTTITFDYNTTSNTAKISSDSSKVYKLIADTSGIKRTDPNTNQAVTVSIVIEGNKGYASGNTTNEPDWADGNLVYEYSFVKLGDIVTYDNLSASDSYQLDPVNLSF